MGKQIWKNASIRFLFPILLALYPLRNIMTGVDLSDTTYSLANYMFLEEKGGMNLFSTYLANIIGNWIMKLPFGNTMLGMNFYSALLISAMALMAYFFFQKKMPPILVFLGEFLAISLCWCPTVILYNYLTYFFFTLAIICLYEALVKEKKILFLVAGILLAFNVFVRFPNVLETGLILAVWYYGYLHKKKISEILKETGICVAGFVAGIAVMLLAISIKYGFAQYLSMLNELFVLGSGGDGGYSPFDMILSIIRAYRDAGKWLFYLLVYTALGVYLYRFKRGKYEKVKTLAFALGSAALVFFLYKRGMFNTNYRGDYLSMFQWAAIILILAITAAIFVISQKHRAKEDKLLAVFILLIMAIIPLGSNNYIYPNINYMFLVVPFVLGMTWEIIKQKETGIALLPIKTMLILVLAVTFLQSTLFGCFFVFRGGNLNEKWNSRIENNQVLRGMRTSQTEKEAIEQLTEFADDAEFEGKKVVLFGFIPGVSYVLKMPCAISTTYPDMDSYAADTFSKELTNIEKPIIILGNQAGTGSATSAEKLETLNAIIKQKDYNQTFSNALFTVYQ